MNNLPYRDQGKQVWQVPLYIKSRPYNPGTYDVLTEQFTREESIQYAQLAHLLVSKQITEDEFNKKHDALFAKARGRWNSIYIFMQLKLGNLWRYMDEQQLEEFYQSVTWIRKDEDLRKVFPKYVKDLKEQLEWQKQLMEHNARIFKDIKNSNEDMIAIKLAGGRHSDIGSHTHEKYDNQGGFTTYIET